MTPPRVDAVVFDLLTGLLDSWTLWNSVAGDQELGFRWRSEYLQRTYAAGRYRPYEDLVAEAAGVVGLPPRAASELLRRWSELRPWPEVGQVLGRLSATHRLAVATNCSEELARRAAAAAGADFGVVVSAERAGWYKPRAEVYRLTLAELGVPPARALFVAGSAYDVGGAAAVGMPVFWHNRAGLRLFDGVPPPLATESTLWPLLEILTQDV